MANIVTIIVSSKSGAEVSYYRRTNVQTRTVTRSTPRSLAVCPAARSAQHVIKGRQSPRWRSHRTRPVPRPTCLNESRQNSSALPQWRAGYPARRLEKMAMSTRVLGHVPRLCATASAMCVSNRPLTRSRVTIPRARPSTTIRSSSSLRGKNVTLPAATCRIIAL